MFKFCTDQEDVKEYAVKIIAKINDRRTTLIIDKDDQLKENDPERDVEPTLRKKRFKERKHDFIERIHIITIKELMTKQQIQARLSELEQYQHLLEEKEGDKKVEELLGIKLQNKYQIISHYDDKPLREEPVKDKK